MLAARGPPAGRRAGALHGRPAGGPWPHELRVVDEVPVDPAGRASTPRAGRAGARRPGTPWGDVARPSGGRVAAHDAVPPGHRAARRRACRARACWSSTPATGAPVAALRRVEAADAGAVGPGTSRPATVLPSRPTGRSRRDSAAPTAVGRARRRSATPSPPRAGVAALRPAAPGVVLLVPLLRGGHRRRRRGEPRRPRRARPRRSTSSRSTTAGATGSGSGWRLTERFARWPRLVGDVRATGRRAGIWLAPFFVGADTDLAREHPDWLIGDAGHNWGQDLLGLDLTHPGVREYLARRCPAPGDLGIDYFKLDFLYAGAVPGPRHDDVSGVAAYRSGLALLRDAAGPDAYLVGCGAPILPSVGLVDAMRVSPDTFHEGGEDGSRGLRGRMSLVARAWQQGRFWVNDPDCLVARPSYALREEWAARVESVRRPARPARTGSPSSTTGAWTRRARLLDGADRRAPFGADVLAAALEPVERTALSDETLRVAGRPLLELLYPGRGEEVAERVLALASRARRSARARPRARPSERTAVPHHVRRRGPARRRDPAAHAGRGPARPRRRRWSATCTCCRSSRGPPTTGSPSSTTGRSNPALGTWDDVADLAADHALMLDFVANHVSASSPWFTGLARRRPGATPASSSSATPASTPRASCGRARCRCSTRYPRPDGSTARRRGRPSVRTRSTSTCATPAALLELTDVLLGYLARGRVGRAPRRHRLPVEGVRHDLPAPAADPRGRPALAGAASTTLAPGTQLLTETNVPHAENVSVLRRRLGRGAPRLPVRAAAARAARVRLRQHRAGSRRGRRASARSARPPPGSTSSPATTASGCAPPRAS